MKENEIQEILTQKNELIIQQTRRILQLEEKLTEVRHKYFQLKYNEAEIGPHYKWGFGIRKKLLNLGS